MLSSGVYTRTIHGLETLHIHHLLLDSRHTITNTLAFSSKQADISPETEQQRVTYIHLCRWNRLALTSTTYQIILDGVIQSFRLKGLKRLFEDGDRKGIRAEYLEKIENILAVLNRARVPEDMNLPGFRLHPLKDTFKGFYAVTVRANYRVIFRFEQGHAHDIEFLDSH